MEPTAEDLRTIERAEETARRIGIQLQGLFMLQEQEEQEAKNHDIMDSTDTLEDKLDALLD